MQPMANIALRAARKAGDFMLRAMDRPEEFDIETKSHNDFVSNIDKTAEAIIIDQIRETFPDHAIIGEESGKQAGSSEYTWIIDPLDGTLKFLQGIPHFAISIGIMKGRHHEHGVITTRCAAKSLSPVVVRVRNSTVNVFVSARAANLKTAYSPPACHQGEWKATSMSIWTVLKR